MTTTTVEATLQADGVTLHLEKKLALPPGRVTVTVIAPGVEGARTSIFDLFGKAPHLRTAEEIAAQMEEERNGWDEP